MADQLESEFIEQINQNLGIADKVGRIYFPDADESADVLQEMMSALAILPAF